MRIVKDEGRTLANGTISAYVQMDWTDTEVTFDEVLELARTGGALTERGNVWLQRPDDSGVYSYNRQQYKQHILPLIQWHKEPERRHRRPPAC